MLVSVILFFFIRVDNPVYRVLIRIALIPVIAGISYEIIRLAGKSNNILVRIRLPLPRWRLFLTGKRIYMRPSGMRWMIPGWKIQGRNRKGY